MANASIVNSYPNSVGDLFNGIWKLSRTMLAAGWRYKTSGNGQSITISSIQNTGTTQYAPTNGSSTVSVTNLVGTFNVTNGSPTVTSTTNQATGNVLVVGSILVFSSQPGVQYTVSAIVTTTITLSTNYTGTSNAAATAYQTTSQILATAANVTVTNGSVNFSSGTTWNTWLFPGATIIFSTQPTTLYTVATVSTTAGTLTTPYTGTTSAAANAVQALSGFFAPVTSFGAAVSSTVSVSNGSSSITFATSQTMSAGDLLVFSSQPGVYYALNAAVSGTSGTLTANYTGTSNGATTSTRVPTLTGTFNATNGATNIPTTASQVSLVSPGDTVMFSAQPGTFYVVSAVSTTALTLVNSYTGTTNTTSHASDIPTGNIQVIFSSQTGVAYPVGSFSSGTMTLTTPYTGSSSTTATALIGAVQDTSANEYKDWWAQGGIINLTNVPSGGSGSGTGVSITSFGSVSATGYAQITGLSGFTASSVGRVATITGSTQIPLATTTLLNANGSYRIVSATPTSIVIYAPGLSIVPETGNSALTVTEQYGGVTGSIGAFSTVTSGQSPLINFSVTGFTGFTSSDVGRFLSISGAASASNNGSFVIAAFVSSSNVLLYNPSGVASDANNGSIQWVEFDPKQEMYPYNIQTGSGSGAWLNLQGPTTMKIPIGTNVPTGTFIRGENVTQSTTGAQGEILGIVPDSIGGTGFIVVAPRVLGTGAQASSVATYGWNNTANTDTVTGSLSGATVTTPVSSTPIAYIREVVFWKNVLSSGHIYYQCIDQNSSTESATTAITGRFSTIAAFQTCTSTLCPGGSNSGSPVTNGFPTTGTSVIIGTGGSGAFGTGAAAYPGILAPAISGRAHLLVANCIEQQGASADGTWTYLQSDSAKGYEVVSLQRMDNQEDGDLDPYIAVAQTTVVTTRTVATASNGTTPDACNIPNSWFSVGTNTAPFRGWRRRGLGLSALQGPESWVNLIASYLIDSTFTSGNASNVSYLQANPGFPDQLATGVNLTYVREPIWALALPAAGTYRIRKGTLRWMMMTIGVAVNSTLDSGKWIVASSTPAPFVFGPWDGTSIPTF